MAINVMDVNWWPESEYHEIQKKGHPGKPIVLFLTCTAVPVNFEHHKHSRIRFKLIL